jgi:hypothetical protein
MWTFHVSSGAFYFPLMALMAGCGMQSADMHSRQADIGFGIVEGTKGYQRLQQDMLASKGAMREVKGQVLQIEGGAYVVRINDRIEARLPIDENTLIDRPAHVGDWIEAHVDKAGRARIIQNIDEHIILELE